MKIDALEEVKRMIREGRVSRDEIVRQLYVELHTDNSNSSTPIRVTQAATSAQQPSMTQEKQQETRVEVENIAERPARSQEDVIAQAKAAAKAMNDQEREVEAAAARLREKHETTYSKPRQPQPNTEGLSEIEKYVRGMSKKVIESEIPLIQNHWAPELTIVGERIDREVYLDLLMRESRKK